MTSTNVNKHVIIYVIVIMDVMVASWLTDADTLTPIASAQGRRSLWDRGHVPPIFMKGGHPW